MKRPLHVFPSHSLWLSYLANGCRVVGAVLLLGAASGCASLSNLLPGSLIPNQPAPTPASSAQRRAQNAKGYDSLANTLAKLNAKTIRTYVDRYTKPGASRSATSPNPPAVYVDVGVLTRQHPAWQLADAMEKGIVGPSSPEQSALFFALPPNATPKRTLPLSPGELYRLAPARQVVIASNFMDATTRGRQGLDAFLDAWSERQAQARIDDAFLARRSLEDQIAVSTRGTVDLLTLSGVSAKTALELSNLRLKLLANLPTSIDEREAAKARISQIEAELQAQWQTQTDEQEARLREAYIEIPARLRREGEERLLAAQRERENQDRLARQQLSRDVGATLVAGERAPRPEALRLPLPSTRVPLPAVESGSGALAPLPSRPGVNLPPLNLPAAFTPAEVAVVQARITRLRDTARQEARVWAQRSAASEGARWTSSPTAPNHTGRAVRLYTAQP